MTIAMMNLFNAVAISDVGVMLGEGNLVALKDEIEYVYKMEKYHMKWNNIFCFIPKCFKSEVSLFQNDLKCNCDEEPSLCVCAKVTEDDLLSPIMKMIKENCNRIYLF